MSAYEVWAMPNPTTTKEVVIMNPGESAESRQELLNQGFRPLKSFKFDPNDSCGLSGKKSRVSVSVDAWVQASTFRQNLLRQHGPTTAKSGWLAKLFSFLPWRKKAPS